jgi:hypothetical protein
MGPLELCLALAALLIGATGTFSPCGLSVIDTIGPTGHTGGRRVTIAACITFVPGAIAGGILTFGALAALGDVLHGAGRAAYLIAAGIAAFAAVLELRGTRIVPQIRRQLPEHWRRLMPMPVAAALYGVLLGIGFTTFVLSFGVWALAGVSLAVGDPVLGIVVGACFGLGRALPIVVLAPLAGRPSGIRATEFMCERPGVYTGLRRGDAAVLAAAALALAVVPGSAGARGQVSPNATDPSTTIDSLAFERLGGASVLREGGADIPLSGSDPAVGGGYVATVAGNNVRLQDRQTFNVAAMLEAPGADAIAVSDHWLVYRAPLQSGGDGMFARNIANPSAPGPIQMLASTAGSAQLSAPSLDHSILLYGIARPRGSRIVQRVIGRKKKRRTLVKSGRLLLFNPSVKGRYFAYTRTDARHSRLMIRRRHRGGPGRVLITMRRRRGQLWTTALGERYAFATVINPGPNGAGAHIVKRARKHAKHAHLNHRPRGGGNHRF